MSSSSQDTFILNAATSLFPQGPFSLSESLVKGCALSVILKIFPTLTYAGRPPPHSTSTPQKKTTISASQPDQAGRAWHRGAATPQQKKGRLHLHGPALPRQVLTRTLRALPSHEHLLMLKTGLNGHQAEPKKEDAGEVGEGWGEMAQRDE